MSGLRQMLAALGVLFVMLGHTADARQDTGKAPLMAHGGKSRVTIVLPENAGPQTRLAAADLARCLGAALGVEVPTVKRPAHVRTPLSILLGRDLGARFGMPLDDLQHGGCAITTHGNSILIAGISDCGTANGVYTFLMDSVGARWFMPGELYEVMPARPDMRLPVVETVRNPDFSYRVFSGVVGDAGTAWRRRNRIDVETTDLPYYGFGHNLKNIFPASVYGKEHPEYYALIDGKRQVPANDQIQGAQPCFSNPDVTRIAAKAASDYFAAHPTATTFSLCMNDNSLFCRCPGCAELDAPERRTPHGWVCHSDSYFHFVEEVAKIVRETNPGKYLGCYAYWSLELPPRRIARLPDNVVIALTQDTSQYFDADFAKADRELWLAWSKAAAHLGKYDYYGLGWFTPRCFAHLAAEDIRFVKANSAVGFYSEAYPNWCVTAPQLYMAARLYWDSSLDPDSLLDEYYRALFGAAADEMKKLYTILENYWTRPRKGRWFQGLDNIQPELAIADGELIEEAWQCLSRAKALVIGQELARVADVEDHFKFTYQIVKGYELSKGLSNCKIAGADDLAKTVSDAFKILDVIKSCEQTHSEVWLADPLYRHSYYQGERFQRKFQGWIDAVRIGVQSGLARALEFARGSLSAAEFETVREDLTDRLRAHPTAARLNIADAIGIK